MKFEVSKHAYNVHYHGPTGFAVREVKEVLSLQMSRDHDMECRFDIWLF